MATLVSVLMGVGFVLAPIAVWGLMSIGAHAQVQAPRPYVKAGAVRYRSIERRPMRSKPHP